MSILIIVSNVTEVKGTNKQTGTYLPEIAHPVHVFNEKKVIFTIASPNGGVAVLDESSVQDWSKDEACKEFLERYSDSCLKNTL